MADGQRIEHTAANSVKVTDDSPTIVTTLNIPAGYTGNVHVNVTGQDQSSAAGKAGMYAVVSARNQGGTVSFNQMVTDDGNSTPAYWRYQMDPGIVELVASGSDLMLQFTGPGGTDVVVAAWLTIYMVEAAV